MDQSALRAMLRELPDSLEDQTTSFVTFAADVLPSLCAEMGVSYGEVSFDQRELFLFSAGMFKLLQIGRGTIAVLDLSLDRLESATREWPRGMENSPVGLRLGGQVYTREGRDFRELRDLVEAMESFLRLNDLSFIARARGLRDLASSVFLQA